MSLEMLAFLESSRIPSRDSLQNAVQSLGVPLQLDASLDLANDRGFSPSTIKGLSSGFEIHTQPVQELISSHPAIKGIIGSQDRAFSFRWGRQISECACVLGVSASLVQLCDAVVYYPADDITYDLKSLLDELQSCLRQI